MLSVKVLDEVRSALLEWRVARFEGGRVVFLDDGQALSPLTPPTSLRSDEKVWSGLEYLRTAKPPVALLLTLHEHAADFQRLVRYNSHTMGVSPVCGVEAFAVEEERPEGSMPRSQPSKSNKWLRAFQEAEFPWLAERDVLALPCEPQWDGSLAARLKQLDEMFSSLTRGTMSEYSLTAQRQLLHPLYAYMGIFRAWGLVGQFGYWLGQPQVQERLAGYAGHIPITLGSAHKAEHYIFQVYCDLDVVTTVTNRRFTYEGFEEAVVARYVRKLEETVLEQSMPEVDLDVIYPTPTE